MQELFLSPNTCEKHQMLISFIDATNLSNAIQMLYVDAIKCNFCAIQIDYDYIM